MSSSFRTRRQISSRGESSPLSRAPLSSGSANGSISGSLIQKRTLTNCWIPSISSRRPENVTDIGTHDLLEKCGFYHTAYKGLYHFLPLGLQIQEKLEGLIDKHMRNLGASKLSLSSLSSTDLWTKSSRFDMVQSELFKLRDRKKKDFVLSPTHEEEVTMLVKNLIESYRQTPLRLYQITRKYRDEKRPQSGLLRAREFMMKDLYTFDKSVDDAEKAYQAVQAAYAAFFDDLKLNFMAADASSGSMGGDMSHEYHVVSPDGEDQVAKCKACGYCANAEVAVRRVDRNTKIAFPGSEPPNVGSQFSTLAEAANLHFERFVSRDRKTLLVAVIPRDRKESSVNVQSLKFDHAVSADVEDPISVFTKSIKDSGSEASHDHQILYVFDPKIDARGFKPNTTDLVVAADPPNPEQKIEVPTRVGHSTQDLVSVLQGDQCGYCDRPDGTFDVARTVELGHTFNLGDRYSSVLNATISTRTAGVQGNGGLDKAAGGNMPNQQAARVPLQMGCHGIGLSRLIAAVAETFRDAYGLHWPRLMAPFETIILPASATSAEHQEYARQVYDILTRESPRVDCVIDDSQEKLGSRTANAKLIGYPTVIIVGDAWKEVRKTCTIEWRPLKGDATSRSKPKAISIEPPEENLKERLLGILDGF